jgi:hypothetical protein
MRIVSITRKAFLDRVFAMDELSALTEMLCRWYVTTAGLEGNKGRLRSEARVYCFARPLGSVIRESVQRLVTSVSTDGSIEDELRFTSIAQAVTDAPNLELWRIVLCDPNVQTACVRLRITIDGPMSTFSHGSSHGQSTFVFCGAPSNGSLLAKAIWHLGLDESMELVYQHAAWDKEPHLLEAFEVYYQESIRGNIYGAAERAFDMFGKTGRHLFIARSDEKKVMRLVRHRIELPDDRGPWAFIRRLALPLVPGIMLVCTAFFYQNSPGVMLLCVMGAAIGLAAGARIVWKKFGRIRAYFARMRKGLGTLYSKPVEYRQIDLSGEKTPTLVKCSRELEELGARHLYDFSMATAKSFYDGNRLYVLGDATIGIALLRTTESYILFPPRPILLAVTRFRSGNRHVTLNHPRYRTRKSLHITVRCLPYYGWAEEVVKLHQQRVERLISGGAKPLPAPRTIAEHLDWLQQEHEEGRQMWQKHPYSWSDALHDAFKVCPREYLRD